MKLQGLLRSAVMLSVAGATLLAHNDAETPGWIPVLEIRGMSSSPEGAQANVSGPRNLVKGEPFALTLTSGATLCSLGIGETEGPPRQAPRNNIWKLSGEYLGEQTGRHQIRVTSGFTRLAGEPSSATTTQTLSLREGDGVTLDALTGPVGGNCQVHAVTIDARLVMQATDPALGRARYTADLWLVHTDPNGQQQREHLITNVDGSTSALFNFNRLGFPVPVVDSRQGNTEAFIQLTGALRARTRSDGRIDLDVDTNRMIFNAERTDQPSTFSPPLTRKTLTLKVDETTAIDFPPPASGYASLALGEASGSGGAAGGSATVLRLDHVRRAAAVRQAAAPDGVPVQVNGDRLVVNTAAFFKGHRTQMLVTMRRAR